MICYRLCWLLANVVAIVCSGQSEKENAFIQTHTFWPTPVWVAAPKSSVEQQKKFGALKSTILDLAKSMEGASTISNRGGWQWPASDENILMAAERKMPGVGAARQEILESIERGLQLFVDVDKKPLGGSVEIRLQESWANVNRGPDWNIGHWHAPHELAGLLYLGCPGGRCSLSLPSSRAEGNSVLQGATKMLKVPEGSIVFFPGWLIHYVNKYGPVKSSEYRVSIAFNIGIRLKPGAQPLQATFYASRPEAKSGSALLSKPRGQVLAMKRVILPLWPTLFVKTTYMKGLTPENHKVVQGLLEQSLRGVALSPGLLGCEETGVPGITWAQDEVKNVIRTYLTNHSASQKDWSTFDVSVRISAFWTSKQRKEDMRNIHTLAGSDLCGFLCLSRGGCVVDITDPRKLVPTYNEFGSTLGYNRGYTLQIEHGETIVMPSWLEHYYDVQSPSANTQRALSFNAKIGLRSGPPPLHVKFEDDDFFSGLPTPGRKSTAKKAPNLDL